MNHLSPNFNPEYLATWENLTEPKSNVDFSSWRQAINDSVESQKALLNFSQVIQVFTLNEFEEPLKKAIENGVDPLYIAEEAILNEKKNILDYLVAQSLVSIPFNNVKRSLQGRNAYLFQCKNMETLGQIILSNQGKGGGDLKYHLKQNHIDPLLPIHGVYSLFNQSGLEKLNWSPMAWAALYQNTEAVSKFLKIKTDQKSLDETLFAISAPKNDRVLDKDLNEIKILENCNHLMELGANPNWMHDLNIRRLQKVEDKRKFIDDKASFCAGYFWTLNMVRPIARFDKNISASLLSNYFEKLTPAYWNLSSHAGLISSNSFELMKNSTRNSLSEKIMSVLFQADPHFKRNPKRDAFYFSSKKNQGWPLRWLEEQGLYLKKEELNSVFQLEIVKKIENNLFASNSTLKNEFSFSGFSFKEWGDFLRPEEQKEWHDHISLIEKIREDYNKSPSNQEVKDKLIMSMKFNPSTILKPKARI